MKNHLSLFIPLAAACIAASATAQGYDFELKGSDASGSSSFNAVGNWVTNTGAKATFAPAPGYVYFVEDPNQLRSPNGSAASTFQGAQLILGNNGNINWKGANNGSITIPDLVFRGGRISHGQDNMTGTLGGNYHIPGGEMGTIRINDNNPRTFNLVAAFSGSGTLWLDVRNIGGSGLKEINVRGDNSAFTGPVLMEGQNGNGRITLVNETNIGASPATFTPDHLTLNGVTLALGNTMLSAPTHGVLLGSRNVTLEVGAGETALLGGAVSGPGTLTKTGAGLLILNSTNSYSGATTITAGTLAFNATNNHSTVTVQASGALAGTGEVNTATFANGASILLAGNGFGTLSLPQPAGVSLNNAKLSFDLRSSQTGASDRLDIAGPLTLNGVNSVSFIMPPEGLPAGDYELVTFGSIIGTAANITLAMQQANTALDVTPSNIVFKVSVGLYNIALESLPAERIASTTATLPATITAVPSIGGTLRVYYNDGIDGGATVSGWTQSADFGPANDIDTYAIPISNLTLGHTYHYRHAYIINGTEIFLAPASLSFTTLDENLPNTFHYSPSANNMLAWDDPTAWIPDNNGVRELPGRPGDTIQALDSRSYKFTIPSDTSLGAIRTAGGNNFHLSPTNTSLITFTFDAASTTATNLLYTDNVQSLLLGDWAAATRTNFIIQLNQPLRVTKTGNNENTRLLFNAPLTGGTLDHPVPLILDRTGGSHLIAFLRNPNNAFIGDIHAGAPGTTRSIRLYIGDYIQDMGNNLGSSFNNGLAVTDTMFGHPANRIFLRSNSYINMHNPQSAFIFNRTVFGTGQIRAVNSNGWTLDNEDNPVTLNVGPDALFSPGEDAATGTLTFLASTLNLDPATTFKIKVAPATSDKLIFNIRSSRPDSQNPNPGTDRKSVV